MRYKEYSRRVYGTLSVTTCVKQGEESREINMGLLAGYYSEWKCSCRENIGEANRDGQEFR